MHSQSQRHSVFKSFTHFNLKPLRKVLQSISPIKPTKGSVRTESVSTIDFSVCLVQDGLDRKVSAQLSLPNLKAQEAPVLPVTSMTFSKVVDLYEELEPPQEIAKQARRIRRGSFSKPKIHKKKPSRPNTAVDAIMYNSFNQSDFGKSFATRFKAQNSSHLVIARKELLLQSKSSQSSPLRMREPTAREIRLKYRVYNPPLDCFELRRRSKALHEQNSNGLPTINDGYQFPTPKKNLNQVRGPGYRIPYHLQNKDLNYSRSLKLETIPEAVGGWLVLKDPRDPRKRRTKLDYVMTSW